MQEVAIKVNHIQKLYKLYNKPSDRFKEALGFSKKVLHREHYALRDVDFEVKRGETVGIIGTNGAGKSTLLKVITGVLNPTKGTIDVAGRISALLELGAGFNMEYTGIENIYLNGTMMGYSKEEIGERLQTILDFADIGDFVHQPVKTYSSGMFVRLAFAVAINIDPEILIVDEALSVGDVFFQAKCYHKFDEFKKAGKTILFVSHDLGSVAKYCDRVILLDKGEKLAEGKPKEIIDLYKKVLVSNAENRELGDEGTILQDEEEALQEHGRDKTEDTLVWKNELLNNPNVLEYGDKHAEIIDYAILDDTKRITNNIQKNTKFYIRIKIQFHEDIHEPIFAFTIKDLQGTDVTGTNTMYEKVDFGTVKKGDTRVIEFSQMMTLQGKNYLLSLGCVGYRSNDFVVYHRLYDACNINVISDKDTVGFFDMNSKVRVLM